VSLLVVAEGGGELAVEGERVRVLRAGRVLREVRLQDLEGVMALASVGVTAAAVRRLLRAGVEVAFLDQRGRLLGRLTGPGARNLDLRRQQLELGDDPAFCLGVAQRLVAAKIRGQRAVLLRFRRRRGTEALRDAAARLRALAERAETEDDLDAVRGLEGAASQTYFSVFGVLVVNPLFSFSGRSRRPPRDPLNACLSFGYTVLGSMLEGELAGVGLDPLVGFLHRPEYGRPSMALDLLELARAPVVDAVTLRLVNRRQLAPADFGPPEQDGDGGDDIPWLDPEPSTADPGSAVHLSRTGRPVFLRALLAELRRDVVDVAAARTLPVIEHLRRQCRSIAAAIRNRDPGIFRPFELGG